MNSPDNSMEMYAFPSSQEGYGAAGALCKMEGIPAPDASAGVSSIVYFQCDDCAIVADRAAQQGGKIAKEKTDIGEFGFFCLVHDTEGNVIGLHSMA